MKGFKILGIATIGAIATAGLVFAQFGDVVVLSNVPNHLAVNGAWAPDDEVKGVDGFSIDLPKQTTWSAELTREGTTITGRLVLPGMREFSTGSVNGELNGSSVSGSITDDDGNEIATFEGTLGREGFTGSFETSRGETGSWSWPLSPPAPSVADAVVDAS